MLYSNTFHRHLADVAALEAHGVAAPAEYVQLRERFSAYCELPNAAADRLAAEVISPTGADISELRALALAEQTADSTDDAAVADVVRSRVHGTLVQLYEPFAGRAYSRVAEKFDAIADRFAKCAKSVDVLADPGTLVNGSQASRTAWFDAPALAGQLDEWLDVLAAAGRLSGTPDVDDEAQVLIPLVVDTAKIHRRRLWEAWASTGRCGRYPALLALGASVRAAKHPAKLQPYTAPRPLQQHWVQGTFGGGERKITDPEDNSGNGAKAAVGETEWTVV